MADTIGAPVAGGLAIGVGLIIVFSYLSSSSNITSFERTSIVVIPEGASLESNPHYLVPKVIKVTIGVNNTVIWISHDSVPHGLASDDGYTDPFTGVPFDTRARPEELGGPFLMPGRSYEFTFTEPGVYNYHGVPHPWMQGTVIVLSP